ncbi:MAG: VTT domain-containing protein [Nitrososphaerota archaeon]|nr:VTT domain-containing protein [Nitrososphaerota archaeon]
MDANLITYGYIGVFVSSLLTHFMIFVPAPYLIPVALTSLNPSFDPLLVALSSASGATIAKTVVFRVSYEGQRLLDERTRKKIKPLQTLIGKYGWIAAFLAAATPIPDDIVYITLGFTKYSLWRFIIATFSGKMILISIVAFGVRIFGITFIEPFLKEGVEPTSIIILASLFLIIAVMIIYAIIKIDWAKLLRRWLPYQDEV